MKTKLFLSLSLILPFANVACDEAALTQAMQQFSKPPQAVADENPGNEGGEEAGEEGDDGGDEGNDTFGNGFEGDRYCCISNSATDVCLAWCGG